jgi:octaprenyl-diphosphate synthase
MIATPEKFPFELVRPHLELVEESIRAQAQAFDPAVEGYVSYVTGTSGKRIRPALAVLAGGATGEAGEAQRKLGLVLELVHIATLVHDDIMDGADIRRGMPTASARWGASLSVLLGDCLFAHALVLASEFDDNSITRRIALASNEVCMGEILQTQRRFDLTMGRETYFKIIRMKTAALFAAATELSAALNGQSAEVQERLKAYGEKLGMAYQIYDDCLDLVGDEAIVGKTLGTDLQRGKLTLPLLNLIESASEAQRSKLNRMLLQEEPMDVSVLAGLADYQGAIESTVKTGCQLMAEAREDLMVLSGSEFTTALEGLTFFVEERLQSCVK